MGEMFSALRIFSSSLLKIEIFFNLSTIFADISKSWKKIVSISKQAQISTFKNNFFFARNFATSSTESLFSRRTRQSERPRMTCGIFSNFSGNKTRKFLCYKFTEYEIAEFCCMFSNFRSLCLTNHRLDCASSGNKYETIKFEETFKVCSNKLGGFVFYRWWKVATSRFYQNFCSFAFLSIF